MRGTIHIRRVPPSVPLLCPLHGGAASWSQVPLAAALGCCQLLGSLFLHIDKIVLIRCFSWVLIFFLFFVVLFLFKKKAPLQSVIPINIIHLKNSIYIFIYRFLYIYFYVQDGLASCPRSISVGAGDVLGFTALGFQSLPFTPEMP